MKEALLLAVLKKIPEELEKWPLRGAGICTMANYMLLDSNDLSLLELLSPLFYKWPFFSGDARFPVPSWTPELSAERAYYRSLDKWSGEYGAMRLSLLFFLIEELEKEVAEGVDRS